MSVIRLLPRATAMMGVPTFYTRLLSDLRFTRELVSHMRLFTSGSAPLLAETHKEFDKRTGHAILERYGMTETNMNTSNPYEGDRIPGTVGLSVAGGRAAGRRARHRQAVAGRRDRRDRGQGPERLQGLLADAGEDGGASSGPTGSSSPATWASSTIAATSTSSAAPRTS